MDFHRSILILALFFVSLSAHSSEFKKSVLQEIEIFLSEFKTEQEAKGFRVDFEIGNIDPHLQLSPCENSPDIKFRQDPLTRITNTLEVKCAAPAQWKFFVSSKIEIIGDIVMAKRTIPRGAIISSEDVSTERSIINQVQYGGFSSPSEIIGMTAKRTIRQNNIISSHLLTPPTLVKRGDKVVIKAKNSAISVKMNGIALSDGKLGQQISIKNARSNRVIKGRVVGIGQTEVTL